MVKFENRVALTKISHFIKTTPLIIFVDLLSNAKQRKSESLTENIKKYKRENKSKVLKETNSLLKLLSLQIADLQKANLPVSVTHTKTRSQKNLFPTINQHVQIDDLRTEGDPIGDANKNLFHAEKSNVVSKSTIDDALTCKSTICKEKNYQFENSFWKKNFFFKQIKNNYLRKILAEQSDLSFQSFPVKPKSHPFIAKNIPKSEIAFFSKNQGITLSQGNNLLLFLNNNCLFLLENIEQNENISILGGIYKGCVLNHNQISRLAKLSKNDQIYYNLSFFLKDKSNFSKTVSTKTPLCFFPFFSKNLYAKLCFTISSIIKKSNSEFK